MQVLELGECLVVDLGVKDDGLLRRADHSVVERLGEHHIVHGALELG